MSQDGLKRPPRFWVGLVIPLARECETARVASHDSKLSVSPRIDTLS